MVGWRNRGFTAEIWLKATWNFERARYESKARAIFGDSACDVDPPSVAMSTCPIWRFNQVIEFGRWEAVM